MIDLDKYPWLLKSDNWMDMSWDSRFLNISERMDKMYTYQTRKPWRQRYATEEQFAEEYSPEHNAAVLIAFQLLKREYEEMREYVLNHNRHKHNANVDILERIIQEDIERTLLGEDDEQI